MKTCPYCGKEYPDNTLLCPIDAYPLTESVLNPSPSQEQAGSSNRNKVTAPYLVFPDYKWSARDAWKCMGMLLVFQFMLSLVIFALDSHFTGFHGWRRSGFGNFSVSVLGSAISLLTAAYFARTESLASFWKGFGLDRKPSNYVWFGVTMALAILFFEHFMFIHGWKKSVPNNDITAFRHTFGAERYFYLMPLLLAAFFEEPVYRGFLYKAFRGSYSVATSMVLIMAWTAIRHWPQYSHSWVAAFDLSVGCIVLCYLREKSDSLWDCIFCHLAFNASGLFVSGILR